MKTYAEMTAELEQLAAHNERLVSGLRAARAQIVELKSDLERVGDHSTNIAETIHYAVTGENLPGARPKGSTASSYDLLRPSRDAAAGQGS